MDTGMESLLGGAIRSDDNSVFAKQRVPHPILFSAILSLPYPIPILLYPDPTLSQSDRVLPYPQAARLGRSVVSFHLPILTNRSTRS